MSGRSILVIGAHPDDEVLGCGGTMARLAAEGDDVHCLLLADGESSRSTVDLKSHIDQRQTAARQAADTLGCKSVLVHSLPDNRLDSVALLDVVKLVESRISDVRPEIIFTHHRGDVNVDHRIVHEAVMAASRPQPGFCVRQLYFYEVASSTEWRFADNHMSFSPNAFFDISTHLAKKLEALEAYAQEMRTFPHPRSAKAVEALARWRGATVGVEAAEAFSLGRLVN